MIPLFVGLTGRRIVIFGGGEVAARKAAFFAGEADVHVISRSHADEIRKLPVTCTTLDIQDATDEEIEEIVHSAFIAVAALSDRGQNNRVGAICRRKGILFNNADGKAGDLIIPSVSSGRQYMIAVSTLGKSPAISRFIREHLDTTFERLDEMIELQAVLRRELKEYEPSRPKRTTILRDIARDPDIWDALSLSLQHAEDLARRKYFHG